MKQRFFKYLEAAMWLALPVLGITLLIRFTPPLKAEKLDIKYDTNAPITIATGKWVNNLIIGSIAPQTLCIVCDKGEIVINLKTGHVDLPAGLTCEESAVKFWEAVTAAYPSFRQQIIESSK